MHGAVLKREPLASVAEVVEGAVEAVLFLCIAFTAVEVVHAEEDVHLFFRYPGQRIEDRVYCLAV